MPTSVLGCWRRLCDRMDHRIGARLVESYSSVLVIKMRPYSNVMDKEKYFAKASRNGEVHEYKTNGEGFNRFSSGQSNRLLHHEKER